jgi:hypothetical protein
MPLSDDMFITVHTDPNTGMICILSWFILLRFQNGTPGKDSPSTSPTSMSQTSSDNPFDIEDALGMQNLALGLDEPETRVNVTKAMEDYEKIKNDARKTMDGNKKTTKGGEPARPPPTPPTTDDDDDASNDNEEAPNDDGGIWDEDKEAVDHHVETALTVTPKIRTRSPLFSSRKRAHKRSRKT